MFENTVALISSFNYDWNIIYTIISKSYFSLHKVTYNVVGVKPFPIIVMQLNIKDFDIISHLTCAKYK